MPTVDPSHVKALRRFNRIYTQRIGILKPYLDSHFSLTEVRVLYELAHRQGLTATVLARELGLDAGYLSRILRRFEASQWLVREPAPADARQSLLRLSEAGYQAFAPLQQRSRDEAAQLLEPLDETRRARLLVAFQQAEAILDPAAAAKSRQVTLRDPQAGDMGWVVQQHGEIYWNEYRLNTGFEALVAGIVAKFVQDFQPEWERCWIATVDGQRAGSAFVVRTSKTVAQLRLLILTPEARGMGLGARLTDECIRFARAKGYKKMTLWTNSVLHAARAIYAQRGFRLVKSEPYSGFGQNMVGETWDLRL